tara:strand:- start:733 stop:1062 length:330 start_codon:yes stop_codon:yes gene_type:complete
MSTYTIRNSNGDVLREIEAEESFFVSTSLTDIHPDAHDYVIKIFLGDTSPERLAKRWRSKQLESTDWYEAVPNHSEYAAFMTYRQKLRDWPSTSEWPDKPPHVYPERKI